MKVRLRNPTREIDVEGRRTVARVLDELELAREAHLVIRNGALVHKTGGGTGDDDRLSLRRRLHFACADDA